MNMNLPVAFTMQIQKNYVFYPKPMKIRDFILWAPNVDMTPEGQRLETAPKLEGDSRPSKAQGIIHSILCGMDLGSIILSETPNKSLFCESVDGGHRKRYIIAFVRGEFKCFFRGLKFGELPLEDQEKFLERTLNFIIYQGLEPADNAFIFQSVNKSTDVNHQENLNAYNVIPVAKVIREVVRPVPGVGNTYHELFEFFQRPNSAPRFKYLQFDNHRLRIDEMVARIFYRYYDGGGVGVCERSHLEAMYQEYPSQEKMDELAKKVRTLLNHICAMAVIRKRFSGGGLTLREFRIFERLYMHIESQFGKFRVIDNDVYYQAVMKAYSDFDKPYDHQPDELKETSPFNSQKTIGKQFNDSLNEYDTVKHAMFPVEQLLKRMDLSTLIRDIDNKRMYTHKERDTKLREQGYICAIDGKPLTLVDGEAGHIISHANGGRTVYSNMAMIRKEYNREMGTLSIMEYCQLKKITPALPSMVTA